MEEFKTQSSKELLFFRKNSNSKLPTFSLNLKTYQSLVPVWAMFLPRPVTNFICDRIRNEKRLLQQKVDAFSSRKEKNTQLTLSEKKRNTSKVSFLFTFYIRGYLWSTIVV